MTAYDDTYFRLLQKENKALINIWKEELKYHVGNYCIIDGIFKMHSEIISECIDYIDNYTMDNVVRRYRDDEINLVVRGMSINEILTPINYEYIITRFFAEVPSDEDEKE